MILFDVRDLRRKGYPLARIAKELGISCGVVRASIQELASRRYTVADLLADLRVRKELYRLYRIQRNKRIVSTAPAAPAAANSLR